MMIHTQAWSFDYPPENQACVLQPVSNPPFQDQFLGPYISSLLPIWNPTAGISLENVVCGIRTPQNLAISYVPPRTRMSSYYRKHRISVVDELCCILLQSVKSYPQIFLPRVCLMCLITFSCALKLITLIIEDPRQMENIYLPATNSNLAKRYIDSLTCFVLNFWLTFLAMV